ncbi:MAG: hypothetical protein ABI395_00585 [Sphingobium sp.]
MNALELIVGLGSGGGVTLLAQSAKGWLVARGERHRDDRSSDIELEVHRDKLTFDLLSAARVEVAAARDEVALLRPAVARLALREAHLEEALDQIDGLLNSDTTEELKAARRRARAFVNRMRRLSDAKGTIMNEVQRQESIASLQEQEREK